MAEPVTNNQDSKRYYPIRYDENHSPKMGADDLFAGYSLVMDWGVDPLARLARADKSIVGRALVMLTTEGLALYTGGVQHEIFGHGYRDREAGCEVEYDMWPFPIEFGQTRKEKCPVNLGPEHGIMDSMGGLEATQAFSVFTGQNIKLYGGNLSRAILYIDTHLDISNYIDVWNNPSIGASPFTPFSEKEQAYPTFKGDIVSYWHKMSIKEYEHLRQTKTEKEIYDEGLWQGPNFSYNNIRAGAVYNLLDPYTLYLGYQGFKYLFTGKADFNVPDYLPRTNFILSPNGPEYYLTWPVMAGKTLIEPQIRTTANKDKNAFGAGVAARNIQLNLRGTDVVLDGSVNVWKAPDGMGVSAEAGVQTNILGRLWKPLERFYLGGSVTAKTDGYVMAQPIEAGVSGAATLSYISE